MKYLERLLLLLAAVMLAGTNKCREDYFFATQARVSISPTASGTGTVTPEPTTEDDGTVSPTATEDPDLQTPDPDEEGTPTATPTVTATVSALTPTVSNLTPTSAALISSRTTMGLLAELKTLDQPNADPESTISATSKGMQIGSLAGLDSNWLGNMHKKNDEAGTEETDFSWTNDSDSDGYADALENALGADPLSANSIPTNYSMTSLTNRISRIDADFDGLSNDQESKQGTNPNLKDSDGDGIADGIEFLSGTNALSLNSVPFDSDGDGLSDDYEVSEGINPSLKDSDGDGVSDNMELEIGSNSLAKDSDLDGIFDAKEYQLGSDPAISDFPNK